MSGAEYSSEKDPVYGPQVRRPLKIRVLQYASLFLAVAGLVLLYLFSVNQDIPLVRIGQITPTMNFATVRVTGEVTRNASLLKSGGIVFDLTDGSGKITILGGRMQAQTLETAGKIPRRGDRVEVIGNLSIGADQEAKLRLRSTDQFVLIRKPTAPTATVSSATPGDRIAEITAAQKGEEVAVIGTLQSIDVPGPGSKAPYVLTLAEDRAKLAVIFWEDVLQGLDKKLPRPGQRIRVYGRVDVYKGAVQLKVRDAADLRVMEPSP